MTENSRTRRPAVPWPVREAVARGWPVFPLHPYSKVPAVTGWQRAASTDPARLELWWAATRRGPAFNVGIACGPAGLVVLDLDDARGQLPPPRWGGRGLRHGRDVFAVLAAAAGAAVPATFTVATPSGGEHRYFTAPAGASLRNTAGTLGWRIDTRAAGGYVVAAGSALRLRGRVVRYRVTDSSPVAALPGWLCRALTPVAAPHPVPAPDPVPAGSVRATSVPAGSVPAGSVPAGSVPAGSVPAGSVPAGPVPELGSAAARCHAYVRAALHGEAGRVAAARVGTRNQTLFRAAASLGELVGAGVLSPDRAAQALLAAAGVHLGVERFTEGEARRVIGNGLARGRRHPRQVPGWPR
jgi:hypothetical protein